MQNKMIQEKWVVRLGRSQSQIESMHSVGVSALVHINKAHTFMYKLQRADNTISFFTFAKN